MKQKLHMFAIHQTATIYDGHIIQILELDDIQP